MCLAVPARVLTTNGHDGVVDLHGNELPISMMLVPEAEPGDWVLVHAGFAIQQLSTPEAQTTLSLMSDLQDAVQVKGGDHVQPD